MLAVVWVLEAGCRDQMQRWNNLRCAYQPGGAGLRQDDRPGNIQSGEAMATVEDSGE